MCLFIIKWIFVFYLLLLAKWPIFFCLFMLLSYIVAHLSSWHQLLLKMLQEPTNQKTKKNSPVCISGMMTCFLRHAYVCLWKPLWKLQDLWIVSPSHHSSLFNMFPMWSKETLTLNTPSSACGWIDFSLSISSMADYLHQEQDSSQQSYRSSLLASSEHTTWVVLPQGLHKKIVNLFVPLSWVRYYTPIMTIHNAESMPSHTATILCLESQVPSIPVRRNRNSCLSPCGGEWVSSWPDQDGKLRVDFMMFNVLYIQYCIIHLSKYNWE